MKTNKSTLRNCENGHSYYKSSSCPTCPVCENERKPTQGFLSLLSAPARRALENHGITQIEALAQYTEREILKLHGLGKSSIPILIAALQDKGLSFKEAQTPEK